MYIVLYLFYYTVNVVQTFNSFIETLELRCFTGKTLQNMWQRRYSRCYPISDNMIT